LVRYRRSGMMRLSGTVCPGLSGSSSDVAEPELQDVVKFLSSEDYIVVSNAASYLQHLAYNDDSMKNKIR